VIDQVAQRNLTADVLIQQKVNAAHREAFRTRFPGQVNHIMRLTAERLQAVLTRKPADMTDPSTWVATPFEIEALSKALYSLSIIAKAYPDLDERVV